MGVKVVRDTMWKWLFSVCECYEIHSEDWHNFFTLITRCSRQLHYLSKEVILKVFWNRGNLICDIWLITQCECEYSECLVHQTRYLKKKEKKKVSRVHLFLLLINKMMRCRYLLFFLNRMLHFQMKVGMYLIKDRALFHILLVLRTVRAPHTQSVLSIKNSHHDSLFACNNTEACTLVICRCRESFLD